MHVQPYLFFNGRADEAVEFYRQTLGAEVTMLMRFKDSPDPDACPPSSADKVMHMALRIGDTVILGSDGMEYAGPKFQGFALSVTVASAPEAEKKFQALEDGGTVQMPLAKTFFAERFGMVTDRFGIQWMIVTGT
jgi:PhnB protein